MGKIILKNSFTKGINRDVHPRFQPAGTWRHALNKKKIAGDHVAFGLVNELRNAKVGSVEGKIVGFHRVEERNATLVFHVDGAAIISLFFHDTKEIVEVVRDSDFGCTWSFSKTTWIGYGHNDSKTLAPCNELIIYWASNHTAYLVNVDEMLDPVRKAAVKLLDEPCKYFHLIRESPGPRVRIRANRGGGKDLVPGQYFAVAILVDETNNTTNWGVIEGPAYIGGKYNKFTDVSRQSLQIQAKNLSGNYSRIKIAVIPPVGSASQDVAYVIYDGSYNTNGVSVEYYSQSQHMEEVPIAEILVKNIKYLRPANMIADDGRLYLYKTLQEFNVDGQKWANQIKISAIAYAVPASVAHRFKGFTPDEVQAFAVEWGMVDDTWTPAFHVPGPTAAPNELSCGVCDLPNGHTSNNAALIEEYVKFDTASGEEDVCVTGGQQTTENEGYDPTKCIDGQEDLPITPRSTDSEDDCVSHVTDREAMEAEIEGIETRSESLDDCIDCAQETTKADLNRQENWFVRQLEYITDLFRTDKEVADDCTTGKHTTIPEAAKTLYDEAIANAERDEEILYRTTVTKTGGKNLKAEASAGTKKVRNPDGSVLVFGTTKGEDCVTEEVEPIVLAKYRMGGWESSLTYPKTLGCDGKPLYGELAGLPIRHFKFPDPTLVPLFYSTQRGVETRHDPSNIPGKDTYVVLLGIEVENVYLPSYEAGELPKPANKNNPWRIVVAKKEAHNKSVLYRGYFTNTFLGKIGNKEYAVPRHAANSYANVDRSILNADQKHIGEDWDKPIYMFHSPDASSGADFIYGDYVKIEGKLTGYGDVYGGYVRGRDVTDEKHRLDRRGARGAMNFTQWEPLKFQTCLKGAEFAEFNTNLQNPTGISYPLLNKYREGAIFLETAENLPEVGENGKDKSFNVGGLDHEYNTRGQVLFGTIKRFNSQQYGSVESLQYVDIGVVGRPGQTGIRILTGDSFVQKWSNKRTSYISDGVGNALNVDYSETASPLFLGPPASDGGRDRGVCDPPNRRGYRMREFLGFWNPLELPKNGDRRDPKNMANGHPTLGAVQIWGSLNTWGGIQPIRGDLFYERTLTHLNHLVVSSDVNLYYRSTSPPETREVFYEELQGLDVDPSINNVPPEDAWLSDWHNEHKQPTKKQLEKMAKIRFALVIGGPALFAAGIAGVETSLEAGTTALMAPFFGVLWLLLVNNVLTVKKLMRLLGMPECKTDDEGARAEDNTKGLKDNWFAYNYGFSAINDKNVILGMPAFYNTCRCDKKYTNNIYASNTQIDTSPFDAWRNFQALSYFGLSGDAGQLERLYIWGNGMYAQTTDGTYQLQHKNPSIPTSGGVLLLGGSPFVEHPTKILEGAIEGFGGTTDPNAGIGCRLGFVSVDYEAREISIFNGQFRSIVGPGTGLSRYWKNNFTFCNSGTRDEFAEGGTHFAIGYDPEYQLIMVTKHDGNGGFTWSFDPVDGTYVSEHSFVPDFYFWDRNKLFSVIGGDIFEHNVVGGYSEYYGKKYPTSVDFATNSLMGSGMTETFSYRHGVLDTEVSVLGKNGRPELFDREETYDQFLAWNQFQTTGLLPVVLEDQDDALSSIADRRDIKISRRELGQWKMNNVLSYELDRDVPVVTSPGCGMVEVPNMANLEPAPKDHKGKTFKGRYINQRLVFNKNDRQIILYGVTTHVDSPDEK